MRTLAISLLALLLVAALLYYAGDAKMTLRQLEPLPTLESAPSYETDTWITFVYC